MLRNGRLSSLSGRSSGRSSSSSPPSPSPALCQQNESVLVHYKIVVVFLGSPCNGSHFLVINKLELAKPITPHANSEPLLKQKSSHSHSSPVPFCLLSGLPTATVVLLMVNLLNDDTYRWDCVTTIVSSFGQIEQGAH